MQLVNPIRTLAQQSFIKQNEFPVGGYGRPKVFHFVAEIQKQLYFGFLVSGIPDVFSIQAEDGTYTFFNEVGTLTIDLIESIVKQLLDAGDIAILVGGLKKHISEQFLVFFLEPGESQTKFEDLLRRALLQFPFDLSDCGGSHNDA